MVPLWVLLAVDLVSGVMVVDVDIAVVVVEVVVVVAVVDRGVGTLSSSWMIVEGRGRKAVACGCRSWEESCGMWLQLWLTLVGYTCRRCVVAVVGLSWNA